MDPFWTNKPSVLVQPDAVLEVVPSSSQPASERYNALARLIIVATIVAALLIRSPWVLAVGALALGVDVLLYKNQHKQERLLNQRPRPAAIEESEEQVSALITDQFPHLSEEPFIKPAKTPSPWEQFMRGPDKNMINAETICDQPGMSSIYAQHHTDRPDPAQLSGLPSTGEPTAFSGTLASMPDIDYSSVPAGFQSKRLPQDNGGYTLGGPLLNGGSVAGPSTRPIQNAGSNLVPRPTVLMFQGQQAPRRAPYQPYQPQQAYHSYQSEHYYQPYQPEGRFHQQHVQAQPYPDPYQQRAQAWHGQPVGDPYAHAPSQPEQQCKPWHLMNQAEQMNWLSRQKRDAFINRLFSDVGDTLAERQFINEPNFNEFDDRERHLDAMMAGATHFKDRWSNWQQRYG